MTHILVFSDSAGIYGAERINERLCRAFAEAGYRVSLAQPDAAIGAAVGPEGAAITRYTLPGENLYDPLNRTPPEVLAAAAAAVLSRARPDLIVFADGCPVASIPAKEIAAARAIPFVVIVHCVSPDWAREFGRLTGKVPALYAAARQVVAVCGENLDLLRRDFGLPAAAGIVIANGRPDVFFAPRAAEVRDRVRQELAIDPGAIVCQTVGRFELVKGYQYLLDALPLLKSSGDLASLRFVWVGTGSLAPRMNMLIAAVAPGTVTLLRDRSDVDALLDGADIVVQPSQYEGMPLAVLEAMAKGLPVIATAVSGIPEALGDAGILLPDPRREPGFAQRLASAIRELAGAAEERMRLGRAARSRAEALFREPLMVQRHLGVVEAALAAR